MIDFKEYNRKMDKTLDVLQEQFASVRAGRANAKVLEHITVEYYGVDTPVGQSARSARRMPAPSSSSRGTAACSRRSKRPSRSRTWALTPRMTAASSVWSSRC